MKCRVPVNALALATQSTECHKQDEQWDGDEPDTRAHPWQVVCPSNLPPSPPSLPLSPLSYLSRDADVFPPNRPPLPHSICLPNPQLLRGADGAAWRAAPHPVPPRCPRKAAACAL